MTGDDTILAMYEAATRFKGVIRQQLANEFDEVIAAALLAAVEAVRAGVEIRDPKLYMHGIIRITMIRVVTRRRDREFQLDESALPNQEQIKGHGITAEEYIAADEPNPLEQLLEAERRRTGLHLVAAAPPRDREILYRSVYLEEDQATVERAMGIDANGYRNLKSRAKAKLLQKAAHLAA